MISLDLALDIGPGLQPGTIPWPEQLICWIEAVRTDAELSCPQPLRSAEDVSLGLRFTDDSTIAENNHWRQRAESTDVLPSRLDPAMTGPPPCALNSRHRRFG